MRLLVFLFVCFLVQTARSQQRYALLIGINQYNVPAGRSVDPSSVRTDFPNLEGAVNDARAISAVIQSRFGFPAAQVTELYDTAATRSTILEKIRELRERCSAGDVAFLFYAGHGSQIRNSKSEEADRRDESIVPANAWEKNVRDITDKELAREFNLFLDKGIRLTVIMDCCHSGSLSRGTMFDLPKARYMPESNHDTQDSSRPEPPERRPDGRFLMISAAQDNEYALEQTDENANRHGAFTLAFLQAIDQLSANASALQIFSSARAILKSNGKRQEPVLAGTAARQQQTLFGLEPGVVKEQLLVPVLYVRGNQVGLQAGHAQFIRKGNEFLIRPDGTDSVLVRIDTILDINQSVGNILSGKAASLKPGQLAELTNWVSSGKPLLKLYVPASGLSPAQLKQLLPVVNQFKSRAGNAWVSNPGEQQPEISFFFKGQKCFYHLNGRTLTEVKAVQLNLLSSIAGNRKIFFNIPADNNFLQTIRKHFSVNKSIQLTDRPDDAHYLLYGLLNEKGQAAYGWMRNDLHIADSIESMPLLTDAFSVTNSYTPDSLYEYAMRLAKIRGWINLSGPVQARDFPMRLIIKDQYNQIIDPPAARIGQHVYFHLVADSIVRRKRFSSKFVYVFMIDRAGSMNLIFPNSQDGNTGNRFPVYYDGKAVEDVEIADGELTAPSGADNYFLLATDSPIDNYYYLFNQKGVEAVSTRGENNPLAELLNLANKNTRSQSLKIPATWLLRRFTFKVTY